MNSQINNSTFSPQTPLSLTSDSSMSEEYILTQDILVNTSSRSPLAVFTDNEGHTESLVIGVDQSLFHVFRETGNQAGWDVQTLTTAGVNEVTAGRHTDGQVHAFYSDDASLLHISLNPDGTWTTPQDLPACTSLRITKAPLTGELVAYGVNAAGQLQLIRQDASGTWQAVAVDMGMSLTDASPVLQITIDNPFAWVLAAKDDPSSGNGGQLNLFTGVGSSKASGPQAVAVAMPITQILLSFVRENSAMFVFTDTAHNVFTNFNFSDEVTQIPNLRALSAAGLIDSNNNLHMYAVDPNGILSVLHQIGFNEDGPLWAPAIPLGRGIGAISIDGEARDAAALFTIQADDSLGFYLQDEASRRWSFSKVQRPSDSQPFHVPAYRTEITVRDANGTLVPNVDLSITAASSVVLISSGKTAFINKSQGATFTTNAMGKVTVVTVASALHTPRLTVSATALPQPVDIAADGNIHAFLKGSASLNEIPAMSEATLQNATVNGQPLAPAIAGNSTLAGIAAKGIINTFVETPGGSAGIAGWALDLRNREWPVFRSFDNAEELEAHRREVEAAFDDGISEFFEDLWEGIKNAVITVVNWVVDAENAVAQLTIEIGDGIQRLVKLAIAGIEDVINVVQSIFNAIGAFLDKVIKWLEAFFAWDDIWNTKTVLEHYLNQAMPFVQNMIEQQATHLVHGFFLQQEDRVRSSLDKLKAQFAGQSLSGIVPSAQAITGLRPALLGGAESNFDPTTINDNSQNNWLLEKVLSFFGDSNLNTIDVIEKPIGDLEKAVASSLPLIETSFQDFASFINQSVSDPKEFGSLKIVDLLNAVENLILGLLKFAEGLLDALLDLIAAVAGAMNEILTTPLEIPLVSALFNLIQKLVDPNSEPLQISISGLFCLVAAIPVTLVYKLINGANERPFPNGVPTQSITADGQSVPEEDKRTIRDVKIAATVIMAFWIPIDMALDSTQKNALLVFKVLDVIVPAVVQALLYPTGIPFTGNVFATPTLIAGFVNWMVGWLPIVLDAGLLVSTNFGVNVGQKIARYIDPVGMLVQSALGGLNLLSGFVAVSVPQ